MYLTEFEGDEMVEGKIRGYGRFCAQELKACISVRSAAKDFYGLSYATRIDLCSDAEMLGLINSKGHGSTAT
jgi:hypothetical protein